MKTILLPTDFSACADNALQYAVAYARSQQEPAHLLLAHVVEMPLIAAEAPLELLMEERELMVTAAHEQLQERIRTIYAGGNHITCSSLVPSGLLGSQVSDLVQERHVTLVVMGTKGASGFLATFSGSNTYSVAEDAGCPLLAVPEGAVFQPFRSIVFAADLSTDNTRELREVVQPAAPANARVLVVHVEEYAEDMEPTATEAMWQRVMNVSDYPHLDYSTTYANNVEEGLLKATAKADADMLVVCPRKHSFFSSLFQGSHTRNLVLSPTVPVLIMPKTN